MRLLMVTGDRAAAAGKHGAFYNTLEEFHKHWDRIDIICPNVEVKMSNVKVFENVFIHSSPLPLIFQPIWILYEGLKIIHHSSFDIRHSLVTCHDYPPFYNGVGAWLLHTATRVPYVLEIMHIPGHPRASGLKEKIYKQLMGWFVGYDAKKAIAVRVINQNETPNFLRKAGIPDKKFKFIPAMYIDLEVFRPAQSEKKYDLIFVGRLVENKGINLFLEAIKKLDASALIVGSGPLHDAVRTRIEEWKLKAVMHGYAKDSSEIAILISQSRLLIMPSYNEGGPRVVLEAMACGVPVLATPVGIVPDLLKNGLGGRIIGWDANDIVLKIRQFLGDSGGYQKHSQAAMEIAAQFEKKAAIKNYADKLKEIVSIRL